MATFGCAALLVGVGLAQEVVPAAHPASAPVAEAPGDALELRLAQLERELADQRAQVAALQAELDRLAQAEQPESSTPPPVLGRAVVVAPGQVLPQAVAWGGPLHVQGQVRGDAVSLWGDVVVHRGGQVLGDAVSLNGRVQVEEGGRVLGNRVTLGSARASAPPTPWARWLRSGARRLGMILALAAGGILVVALLPRPLDASARALREGPGRCLLTGLSLGVLGVGGSALLALTLIGLPAAVLLLAALTAAASVGFVGACQAIGDSLPLRRPGAGRWLALLGGVSLLGLLPALPAPAWVLVALGGAAGIGAVVRGRAWSSR